MSRAAALAAVLALVWVSGCGAARVQRPARPDLKKFSVTVVALEFDEAGKVARQVLALETPHAEAWMANHRAMWAYIYLLESCPAWEGEAPPQQPLGEPLRR